MLINKILRHDITNNLTVVRSAIRLYNRLNERTYLDKAGETIKKSFDLITKMRELEAFMHLDKKLTKFNFKSITNKIIRQHKEIEVNVFGEGVFMANSAMNSVFDNLVNNAINHGKTNKMDFVYKAEEQNVIIEVKDYGSGIPDDIKTKVFQENFIYGKTGNSGLGLYIVQSVIKSISGKIEILDNIPQGTIFKITLPKVDVE